MTEAQLGPYIEWSAYWNCHFINGADDQRIVVIFEEADGYAVSRIGRSEVIYRGTLRECEAFGLGMAMAQ